MKTQNSIALCFTTGKDKFYAKPAEIIRMEAKSNYTKVYFKDHPPLLMAKVLHLYEEILRPYGFVRTHRSHLINANYIRNLDQNNIVHMHDASHVELSRRKKREVFLSITTHITPIGSTV